jgi:hypothetical protein
MNMNAKKTLLTAGLSVFATLASAQSYSIDWHTIDGGSGTSTGGAFSVSGTIGQPDASAMSGGNYSLAGGFWSAISTAPSIPTLIQVWVVGHEVHLRFAGIPGRTYEIERALFVTGPWRPDDQAYAVVTMPIDGVVEFVDTSGLTFTQSFYRTRLR